MPYRYLSICLCLLYSFLHSGTASAQEIGETTTVRQAVVKEIRQAVGTVRPRTETRIESQITARILEMRIHPGAHVRRGDVLVVLDTRELASRRDQARQAIATATAATRQAQQEEAAARAEFTKAESHYRRIHALFASGTVAKSELDQAEAAYARAEADLYRAADGISGASASENRASTMLEEAQIAMDYGIIHALDDGEVVRREAEPGDLAIPGKALAILQTGSSLRLEAQVPEGLIQKIRPGSYLPVTISALPGLTLNGTVEEVVPAADPQSRTVEVRVGLPSVSGLYLDLYPGMFGRLLVPVGERTTLLAPSRAISRVGQLETVRVLHDGVPMPVYVKTGKVHGDDVEILSGLRGGETILLEAAHVR